MERGRLEIRLLGELEVARDGCPLALPRSKKTRALLAYLALTGREHRREHLCDLFWDVADDRRGALRWSLSKLRAIVDDEGGARIAADRERVAFTARGSTVDALDVRRALSAKPIGSVPDEILEDLAGRFRGPLLEGLDLADFDEYQAWCVAERERARVQRTEILAELVRRAAGAPARAVDHARAWVSVDPLSDEARAALVRALGALGLRDEARQHVETGRRLAKELGRGAPELLVAALREIEERPRPAVAPAGPSPGAARAAETAAEVPLVGRARELDALLSLLDRVQRERRAAVVVLSGEPGVGKTRLVTEWLRRVEARGAAAVYGAAFEAESGHPYGPWVDALSRVSPDPLGDATGDEHATRERLFGRVSAALDEIASGAPALAIVLDDAQWLDEGSASLLHWIVRTHRERPAVFVLASREGEIADNAALVRVLRGLRRQGLVEEQVLGALAPEDVTTLVAALGVGDAAERAREQSGGNPLFALELARAS